MKYTAVVQGERVEVEFERRSDGMLLARVGERKYLLESRNVESGIYWFNFENRSIEIAVTPNSEGYVALSNNGQLEVEILEGRAALRKAAQRGQDGQVEVRAPMPGKIVKVLIEEGEEVQANQGLLVMEAMKMQNEIKAPKKGVIRKLAAADGSAVSSGDLLVIIE